METQHSNILLYKAGELHGFLKKAVAAVTSFLSPFAPLLQPAKMFHVIPGNSFNENPIWSYNHPVEPHLLEMLVKGGMDVLHK